MNKDVKKMNFTHLSILAWLYDKPSERVVVDKSPAFSPQAVSRIFFELRRTEEGYEKFVAQTAFPYPAYVPEKANSQVSVQEYFDGEKTSGDMRGLLEAGLLRKFEYDAKADDPSYADCPCAENLLVNHPLPNARVSQLAYGITELALNWWQLRGQEMYVKALGKRLENNKMANRLILIGAHTTIPATKKNLDLKDRNFDFDLPIPSEKMFRPYAIATVVKELPKMLMVDNVEYLQIQSGISNLGVYDPVMRQKGNICIDKKNVLVDHFDRNALEEILKADAKIMSDMRDIKTRAAEELIPILKRINADLFERKSMLDEMYNRLLENSSVKEENTKSDEYDLKL